MPTSQQQAAPARRNDSPKRAKPPTDGDSNREPDSSPLTSTINEWVDQRPWAMVGAAAGIGIALGAASRPENLRVLARTLGSTAGGIATRIAIDRLVQWLQPALEEQAPPVEERAPR